MTKQEKLLYWFLIIITFGLILLYWRTKKNKVKDELTRKNKVTIDMKSLILFLGGSENIETVSSTYTKVKINFKDWNKVQTEKIRKINGISGIFVTSNYIQIIVGNEALPIEKHLKHLNVV